MFAYSRQRHASKKFIHARSLHTNIACLFSRELRVVINVLLSKELKFILDQSLKSYIVQPKNHILKKLLRHNPGLFSCIIANHQEAQSINFS